MPNIQDNKKSKKELGDFSNALDNIPDYVVREKSEASLPIPPQEMEKGREAVKKEISEQAVVEKQRQGEGLAPGHTPAVLPVKPANKVIVGSKTKSPELVQIENILEDDLREVFKTMDQVTKMRFKEEGERTASRIEQAIHQTKIKIKEILDLIRNWLRIIPGVNKYFIEQETKIKGDKITALRK